ncbi:AI-2E family transporter [Erythrobacter sp. HL-111]|uniref:AI-2E family transporter n=1 Tax=Erythrobacter sp. HL-111 TaxID=1798193 RepID=UPI0012FCEB1B|nr:AI-2E family transporter [Erythrobacter sp. HL-111]
MAEERAKAPMSPEPSISAPVRRAFLGAIAFAAVFWLLLQTMTITIPLFAALLLALGVWPLVDPIRRRMPRRLEWTGALVGMLVVVAILALFLFALGLAVQQVYGLASNVAPAVQDRLGALPVALPDFLTDGPDAGDSALASSGTLTGAALTALDITASTLGGIILIVFLMLLMLTEADNWQAKIQAVSRDDHDRRWREIGRSVGQKFRAYFVTRFILSVLSALLYVGWLAIFGVDYLLLWAVLTVLLNFIPTAGSIISGTLPVIYVLVTRDFGTALIIGSGLLAIEQVIGNFIDPKLMGRRLAISPLVVLVALMFWTILWGIPGALLAVPLTVLLTMVMAHFDRTKGFALLLTDCSTMEELEDYRRPD